LEETRQKKIEKREEEREKISALVAKKQEKL